MQLLLLLLLLLLHNKPMYDVMVKFVVFLIPGVVSPFDLGMPQLLITIPQ